VEGGSHSTFAGKALSKEPVRFEARARSSPLRRAAGIRLDDRVSGAMAFIGGLTLLVAYLFRD
jgi:hypothetical protein